MCADENEGPAPCLPGLGCRGRCDLILCAFPGMFPAISLPVVPALDGMGLFDANCYHHFPDMAKCTVQTCVLPLADPAGWDLKKGHYCVTRTCSHP